MSDVSNRVLFSITDTGQVTEESRRAQFLIPVDADGQNRAQASLERAQFLNPMVEVKADTEQVESKPDDFFYQFDAVSAGTSCCVGQFLILKIFDHIWSFTIKSYNSFVN